MEENRGSRKASAEKTGRIKGFATSPDNAITKPNFALLG